MSFDCRNQKGRIRPITLQESGAKLVETRPYVEPWDHTRWVWRAANAQLALDCLRAVARHEDSAEMCSTNIANAFGTLHRSTGS